MPGFEFFGDAERNELKDVLDNGILMRYGFDALRKGHYKAKSLEEELQNIKDTIGDEKYNQGKYKEAVEIFNKMSTSETFEEFLTLPAYDLL